VVDGVDEPAAAAAPEDLDVRLPAMSMPSAASDSLARARATRGDPAVGTGMEDSWEAGVVFSDGRDCAA
jgi:hypothetical protein